jgi:hypothetical protein
MLAISSCSGDAAATLLIPLQDEIEVLKAELAAERTERQQAEARVPRLKPPFLRLCGCDVHRLAMRNAGLTDLLEICHKPINERLGFWS